jgi:hypothetical protein
LEFESQVLAFCTRFFNGAECRSEGYVPDDGQSVRQKQRGAKSQEAKAISNKPTTQHLLL